MLGAADSSRTQKHLQSLQCPLEAGTQSESVYIDLYVKMSNCTSEINMLRVGSSGKDTKKRAKKSRKLKKLTLQRKETYDKN